MKKPRPSTTSRPAPLSPLGQRLILAALMGMVCLVPLTLWKELYEYELLPKRLILHAGIALGCLGWLLQTGWGRHVRIAPSPLFWPALCGMGVALIASVSTTHPLGTLVELGNQAVLLILFFVVASALPLQRLTPVWWAGALTGLAVALIGILQYHGLAFLAIPTNAPPSATFANRNLAAEYLICVMPIAGLLFLTTRSRPGTAMSGLSVSLMAVFLVYTRTRSAWVGAAGALVIVALCLGTGPGRPVWASLRARMDGVRNRWALISLALFCLLAALPPSSGAFLKQGAPDLPGEKTGVGATAASIFQGDAAKDAGIRERLAFWRATWRMVMDHPLFGVGPGGWIRAYPPYDGGATISPQGYHRRPHNDFLWLASEQGLTGLGIYLWLIGAAFYGILKMARSHDESLRLAAPAFALSLIAILIAACFGYPREQPATTLFLWLIFGLVAGATSDERGKSLNSPLPPWGRGRGRGLSFLLPFLFLLVSLGAVELTRRHIAFDRHYYNLGFSKKGPSVALSEVQNALQYGTFLPDILYFKGVALQIMGHYEEADTAYRQMLTYAPHAWYAHEGLGLVCIQEGRFQEALSHLQTAMAICPSAVYNQNNVGVAYQRLGQMNRAEQAFWAALAADPNNPEPRLNLGSIYRLRGQPDSAVAHYKRALRMRPDMPQALLNLAQVTLQQGRFEEALEYYRKLLRTDANNADAHWGLGLASEAGGRPAEAEAAYRRVLALQPGFAQAHLALGHLIYAQGRYREALQAYQTYLGLAPDDTAGVRLARDQIARCEGQLKE